MLKTSIKNSLSTAVKGFTLIELLVTVAIAGVIMMVAVPNMGIFLSQTRIDNNVMELQRLILNTRNAAVSSEQTVTLCPLNSSNVCTNNWDNELSVFIDTNSNQVFEPTREESVTTDGVVEIVDVPTSERILSVKSAVDGNDTFQTNINISALTYMATGNLTGAANTIQFTYCPTDRDISPRAVIISTTGRANLSNDSDGDGEDENRAGGVISCI